MKYLTLERFQSTPDGVFGRLGKWTTVEEQDLGNTPNISCIPPGAYVCRRSYYNRGGYETFEVLDVPGRSYIKFHVANTEEDLNGCVGITSYMGVLRVQDEDTHRMTYKLAGLASGKAFDEFMDHLKDVDEFILIVKWASHASCEI